MSIQSVKFIVVGVSNTVLTYFVFYICIQLFDLSYGWALSLSYLLGIINSYIWNRNWTFKTQQTKALLSLLKFITVYLLTYVVNLAILAALENYNVWNSLINQAFALMITTLISYLGHKYWSFKSQIEVSK